MKFCYDEKDRFFYDRDIQDRFVRVQSNNLIHVLACEVGDDMMFADALYCYLLNTRKYFSRYPITTVAMDDPRFFQMVNYNSWAGQVSLLDQIRLPAAFEYHHRFVELTWIIQPIISALFRAKKFSWSINPWIGCEGYSENCAHSFLCLIDYLERLSGIYPSSDDTLWFTALIPRGIDYGQVIAEETGYSRLVDNNYFEFINKKGISAIYKNGEIIYSFPAGIRLVTSRTGELKEVIGMTIRRIHGEVFCQNKKIPFVVTGNEKLKYNGLTFASIENPGIVLPNYGD
jgi:hypothetical protein